MTPSIEDAKSMARRLRAAISDRGLAATHSEALELVAVQLGFRDWNTTSAALNRDAPGRPRFTQSVPVMLSLDETKCRKFYCEFLGFEIEFEHRFEPHMPAYLGLTRGAVLLHLSPHRGDATTGSAVFVWMVGIDDYRRELAARSDGHTLREPVDQPWGRELTITDPFGNRLRFCEQPSDRTAQATPGVEHAESEEAAGASSGDTAAFALVQTIGAELGGVQVSADSMGTSLKIGGTILACTATHKSAEPESLMVRVGFARRDALLREIPQAFYLTAHYEPYPVVLLRLRRTDRAQLEALLREAREFVRGERA